MDRLSDPDFLLYVLFWFIVFLFSLSVHESAHAWTSSRFGDDTGRLLGRISLNPVPHIDPFGTVLFPLVSIITSIPLFGWAKPVPVNPLLWRKKDPANFWVSAAGPLSNFAIALVAFVVLKVLIVAGEIGITFDNEYVPLSGAGVFEPIAGLLWIALYVNVALGVFNLFPVPPLDGSGVLHALLPRDLQDAFDQLQPYGIVILFALASVGAFRYVLSPVSRLLFHALILW
jgi:Zn-dependent protease